MKTENGKVKTENSDYSEYSDNSINTITPSPSAKEKRADKIDNQL